MSVSCDSIVVGNYFLEETYGYVEFFGVGSISEQLLPMSDFFGVRFGHILDGSFGLSKNIFGSVPQLRAMSLSDKLANNLG
jgi:hypothetical protein